VVKGKAIKTVLQQGLEKGKIGAGAVALEKATDVLDSTILNTAEGAAIGWLASGGNPLGAIGGGLVGFLLADGERIMPCDMVAIPAYQYSMVLSGKEPTFQLFIKEGELVTPVIPTDMMMSEAVVDSVQMATATAPKKRSKWNKYTANKKNQIFFKSGKKKGLLNLKAMGVAYRKANKKKR